MTLGEIRRRPTLPGRFQPSTISVLRLNFCVRDGNRWIPQAIVTGNQAELGFFCCRPLSQAFALSSAPSKPHRLDCSLLSDHDFRFQSFNILLSNHLPLVSGLRSQLPVSAFASPVPCSLCTTLCFSTNSSTNQNLRHWTEQLRQKKRAIQTNDSR